MGEHNVDEALDDRKLRAYMKALLDDLRALEYMLDHDLIESGVRRIGAEQEMFLIDQSLHPAPVGREVLERAGDERLTTEIARFNLEANLTPRLLGGRCFREMEQELEEVLRLTREAARTCGADVLLAGILPTLETSDLTLRNMTQSPRYAELNRALLRMRGGSFAIHIKGLDELQMKHDNFMMEGCNTSFQIHLQVSPKEFVPLYNMAQAITAPVLAAAVNSPLLLGHRLWQETRLALFQHSADDRSFAHQARSQPTRVGFGEGWMKHSVLEMFREQIARFRVIILGETDDDPFARLKRGEAPRLSALRLHNGTIWPWNRPCYGISEGRAHLRIENRALPSGPTVLDELANAAFFLGLMTSLPEAYGEIDRLMSFDDAKANFFAAARFGLNAQFVWTNGRSYPAATLILDELLPLARQGLEKSGVEAEDIDRYLGVIEERVESGRTGANWMLRSLAAMKDQGTRDIRHRALTKTMLWRQQTGEPVHLWPVIETNEAQDWHHSYRTVGQFMSTDLFTIQPDDLIDLAANMMDWRHIRHVPVENEEGKLVGLLSHRALLRRLAQGQSGGEHAEPIAVRSIMKTNPVTATPQTPTLEAIALMRRHRVGCLPVVDKENLVGIVTAQDFLEISARLFEEHLRPEEKQTAYALAASSDGNGD
ncbi:MAG TPA: CBS domain-containing protein [Pyrinomonadaceae bacterium]|jgi:CBS domain-containing protein/gamma-glutamyl:cysteine ligase YbdK (ATP-grasp superfamily)